MNSDQIKMDLTVVQQQKVPSAIYEKILHQEALSLADIRQLASSQVPDAITIRAIENSGAVYRLNSKSIGDLKQNHVSDQVIDAMLRTRDRYEDELVSPWAYPGYPYYPYPYPIYYYHFHPRYWH